MAAKLGKWAACLCVCQCLLGVACLAEAKPLLQVAWRLRIDEHIPLAYKPVEGASPIVTSDGRWVYVGGLDGVFYKVDAVSGKPHFKLQLDGAVSAQPLFFRQGVVVCTEEGSIYYLSQDDLHPLWGKLVRLPGVVRHQPQLLDEQQLVVVDDRGVLSLLALADGSVVTTYSEQSFSEKSLSPITVAGRAQPLFEEGSLFAGFDTGVLVRWSLKEAAEASTSDTEEEADDASDGNDILASHGAAANGQPQRLPEIQRDWEAPLCSEGALGSRLDKPGAVCSRRRVFRDVDTSPVMTESGLLAGCYCRGLMLLDPATGNVIWELPVRGPTRPLVMDETIVFTTADGFVIAAGLNDGQIKWRTLLHGDPGDAMLLPAFQAGRQVPVIVANGEDLFVIDTSTGMLMARLASMHGFSSNPAMWQTSMFLVSNEGFLYRIDYFR